MKLTYYSHSCFAVETEGKIILFDPFITQNPLAKNVNVNSISPHYIFLSHGHGDHIADTLSIAQKNESHVCCPCGNIVLA